MQQITLNFDGTDRKWYRRDILRQGENLTCELVINIREELQGYKYLIKFQNNEDTQVVTPELIPDSNNQIKYIITNALTKVAGILKIELNAYDNEYFLKKTHVVCLRILDALGETSEVMPETYVPWYQQAVEQASIATDKANEVDAKLSTLSISTWEDLLNLGEE